jgi:glyoxylase-like metal-dependent hydrolase (beta-lactamase superfamily II)
MTEIEVLTSGIWQLSSVIVAHRSEVWVIDPAYFPRELEAIGERARSKGRVTRVVFTHGHWDHVMGWRTFPDARVSGSQRLAEAVLSGDAEASKNLAGAIEFDGRWYIDRGEPAKWPPSIDAFMEGSVDAIGGAAVRALSLPGHSRDGLALMIESEGVLVAGDYLSPCEIPFVEDLGAYRATLRRLIDLFDARIVSAVIPGHGPRLDVPTARAIAAADLDYLDALAEAATRGDARSALALPLPRAAAVPGMREHHLENCAAAGLPPI